jgi:hypothetical protein
MSLRVFHDRAGRVVDLRDGHEILGRIVGQLLDELLELVDVVVGEDQCVAVGLRLRGGGSADLTAGARHELHDDRLPEVGRDHAREDPCIQVMRAARAERDDERDRLLGIVVCERRRQADPARHQDPERQFCNRTVFHRLLLRRPVRVTRLTLFAE